MTSARTQLEQLTDQICQELELKLIFNFCSELPTILTGFHSSAVYHMSITQFLEYLIKENSINEITLKEMPNILDQYSGSFDPFSAHRLVLTSLFIAHKQKNIQSNLDTLFAKDLISQEELRNLEKEFRQNMQPKTAEEKGSQNSAGPGFFAATASKIAPGPITIISEKDLHVEWEQRESVMKTRRGKMGVVYRAQKNQDTKDSYPYAIKYFYKNGITTEEARTRAQQELRVWSKLRSVKNSGLMEFKGYVKLTSENRQLFHGISSFGLLFDWCDGGSLLTYIQDYIQEFQYLLHPTDLREWAINLISGLKAMHEEGIIHADIAARNIALKTQKDGYLLPVLIDPGDGIFKGEKPLQHQLTYNGIPHCAPEIQMTKNPHYSEKSDIYSLGMVLVELMQGYLLPGSVCGAPMYVYAQNKIEYISRNKKLRDRYGNLVNIILGMIHPYPDKRPDATQLLEKLNRCLLPRAKEPEEPKFETTHFWHFKN